MPYCNGDERVLGEGNLASTTTATRIVINHTGFAQREQGPRRSRRELRQCRTGPGDRTRRRRGGIPTPLFAGLRGRGHARHQDVMGLPDVLTAATRRNPVLNGRHRRAVGHAGSRPAVGASRPPESLRPRWASPICTATPAPSSPPSGGLRFDPCVRRRPGQLLRRRRGPRSSPCPTKAASIDVNEELTESAGIDLPVYIARPSTDHHHHGRRGTSTTSRSCGVRFVELASPTCSSQGQPLDDVVCIRLR